MSFNNFYRKRIYCDLDGVLCDFIAQWQKFSKTGMTPDKFVEMFGEEEFIEELKKHGKEFWATMPWRDDGVFLWNYIDKYRPIIISRPLDTEESRLGKEWWVKANLPFKTTIVFSDPKTNNKEDWADENSILIDDEGTNVRKFIIHNGNGIIHTSAVETIKTLKEQFGM